MKNIPGGVCAAQGFRANGVLCGIKPGRQAPDLALIISERPAAAAAIYTKNLVKGAPLLVTKEHLQDNQAQAIIVNSGNANTCNAMVLLLLRACARLSSSIQILRCRTLSWPPPV